MQKKTAFERLGGALLTFKDAVEICAPEARIATAPITAAVELVSEGMEAVLPKKEKGDA